MTWRDAGRDDRRLAWLAFACAVVAIVALPTAPAVVPFVPGCWLHAVTGWPCPTCGATRAAESLARGDVLDAIAWNPLAVVTAILAVAVALVAPAWVHGVGRLPVLGRPWPLALRIGVALAVVGNWVYLVIAGV